MKLRREAWAFVGCTVPKITRWSTCGAIYLVVNDGLRIDSVGFIDQSS